MMARAAAHLMAGVLVLAVAWLAGLFWYAADVPRSSPSGTDAERPTDAIVVLTGGSHRLGTGLELLAAGRAKKLFVSGVYDGVDVQELLKLSRRSPTEMECCIALGYSADSTIGNAYETADWMRDQGFRSLRLVTANYHMRRSLLELSMAMPDVELVPHPVVAPTVHLDDWWMWPGTANLLVNEYNKLLVVGLRWTVRRVVRE
nr:YdcF family protein [Azospirillum sp. 412522]